MLILSLLRLKERAQAHQSDRSYPNTNNLTDPKDAINSVSGSTGVTLH